MFRVGGVGEGLRACVGVRLGNLPRRALEIFTTENFCFPFLLTTFSYIFKPICIFVLHLRQYAGSSCWTTVTERYFFALRFGFPEVSLGLLPAASGTQRFPRLVGVKSSMELIASGRQFDTKEALSLGVIDKVLH